MKKLLILMIALISPNLLFGAAQELVLHPHDTDRTGIHPAAGIGPHIDLREYPGFIEDLPSRPPTFFPRETREMALGLKDDVRRWPVVSKDIFYILCGLKPADLSLIRRLNSIDPRLFRRKYRSIAITLQTEEGLNRFLAKRGSVALFRTLAYTAIRLPGTLLLEENSEYQPPIHFPAAYGRSLREIARDYSVMSLLERENFERRSHRLDVRRVVYGNTGLGLFFSLLVRGQRMRIERAKRNNEMLSGRFAAAGDRKFASLFSPRRNLATVCAVLVGEEEGRTSIQTVDANTIFSSGALPVDCPGTALNLDTPGIAYLTAPELDEPICYAGSFFPREAVAAFEEARRQGDVSLSRAGAASAGGAEGAEDEESSDRDRFRALQEDFYKNSGAHTHEHSPSAMNAFYANAGCPSFEELTARGHARFHGHSEQLVPEYFERILLPTIQGILFRNPDFSLQKLVLCVQTDRDPCPGCVSRLQRMSSKYSVSHVPSTHTVTDHPLAIVLTGYRGFGSQVRAESAAGRSEFAYRDSRHPLAALRYNECDLSRFAGLAMINAAESGSPIVE
jgi:hypothetical protein